MIFGLPLPFVVLCAVSVAGSVWLVRATWRREPVDLDELDGVGKRWPAESDGWRP